MGLEHKRAFGRERLGAVRIIFHLRVVDDQLAIEPDRGDVAFLDDAERVPFAERFVGDDEWIASRGAWRVIEKTSRTEVRFTVGLLRVEDLIEVPDLDLRLPAEVDARIGLRDRLIFDAEFDVAEFLVGRRIRARAGID